MTEESNQQKRKLGYGESDNTSLSPKEKKQKLQNIDVEIISVNPQQFFLTDEQVEVQITYKTLNSSTKKFFVVLVEENSENKSLLRQEFSSKSAIVLKILTKNIDPNFNFSKKLLIKFENISVDFGVNDQYLTVSKFDLRKSEYHTRFDKNSLNYILLLYLAHDQNEAKLAVATDFLKRIEFDKNETDSKEYKLSTWNSFFIHESDENKIGNFGNFIKQFIHEYRFGFNFNFLHHLCSIKGTEGVVKILLEEKIIDVNERDNFGNTPLFYSELHQHKEVSKLLIEKGALTDITNNEDQTIAMYAKEQSDLLLTSPDDE